MNIHVNGKQIDIGVSLSSHVNLKINDLTSKYSISATEVTATFSRDRYEFLCHISVHISTGMTAQSNGKANDVYASFENSLEKIAKQLRRYKRRLKDHHIDRREPIEFIDASSYVISPHNEEGDSHQTESLKPLIIAEMQTKIPTLSVGEAVMQMELTGSNFLIFHNSSHKKINLVHIREDDNIGWVDPDYTK